MKPSTILLALMGLLPIGCANRSEKIIFTSEPVAPRHDSNVPASAAPSLTPEETAGIEREIYSAMLHRDLGAGGNYSAVFLLTDEGQTKRLQQSFPRHDPPIKQLWHADLRQGFAPRDQDTGRPALVFSAVVSEPETNGVTGIGRWNAGDAMKGFYKFTFEKSGGQWVRQNLQ